MPFHRKTQDREIVDARGQTWSVYHDRGMPVVQPGQPDRTLVVFRTEDEWLVAFAPDTAWLDSADYLDILERALADTAPAQLTSTC